MTYAVVALLAVIATIVLDLVVLRSRVLVHQAFWPAYAIILVFQLIANGVLTGRGIVHYAGGPGAGVRPTFLGDGRIAFAPYQDLLFGFALVVQTLSWWVLWGSRLAEAATGRDEAEERDSDGREQQA